MDAVIEVNDEYPPEIKDELHSRVQAFFGKDGFSKLQNSFVIVVGLGGVGSHCANMLVRSGVGSVRLIDYDQVTLSSLNRHAVANLADVGKSKADCMRRRLLQVVPWCRIDAISEMFKIEDAERLLLSPMRTDSSSSSTTATTTEVADYVIDCIDDVNTKAELIAFCKQHALPVLTAMGAGAKMDPTRIRIAALSDCINDPLASKIKWKLKKQHGVQAEDVTAVYSVEKPICDLLPLSEEQKQAPQDYGAVDYLRLRVIPVLGTSPSIFGQALASYVLCTLAQKRYQPETCERMSQNLKHKMLQVLRKNEVMRFGTDKELNLDGEDFEFVVQQIWRSRCAVTNLRFGGHVILTLTRWDSSQPPAPYNLVLLMQNEALKLAQGATAEEAFGAELANKINSRLQWAKRVCADSWETLDHTGPIAITSTSSSTASACASTIVAATIAASTDTSTDTSSGMRRLNTNVGVAATATAAAIALFAVGFAFGRRSSR